MASRYLVAGGTGDWNSTSNWSATSGGSSGASFPVLTDDVFIDALSGTSTLLTVNVASECLSLNFTGAITPTFAGGSALGIYGNLTTISAMTFTFSGGITFKAATTGKTITTNGKSIVCAVTFDGVGGGWTLQDNFTTTNNLTVTNGSFISNGKTVTCTGFTSTNTNTRSVTLGSSILNISAGFNFGTTTGLTFSAGTSTINMLGNGTAFSGGGLTFNIVNFTIDTTMNQSNTFNTVTIAAGGILRLTSGTTQIITSLVSNGTQASLATLQSVTAASAATISTPSTLSVTYLSVKDITRSGAGSLAVLNGTNVSGNTGITFTSARYWVNGNGTWDTSSTTHWSTASGGSSGASVPTSADGVFIDANSGASPTITLSGGSSNCLNIDFTGAITPTLTGGQSLNVYGSLTFISTMVCSLSSGIFFRATSTGKTVTSGGISISTFVNFVGVGGGWTLQDNLTTTSNLSIDNGAFNTGNKNISCTNMNLVNTTNTRSITLGSSTITCSQGWQASVATGLTITANTSTIVMTGNTQTFDGGGLTYNNVTLSGTPITITGSNTIALVTIATGKTLKLTSGTTQTITSLVCNGTTASPSTLQSVTAASAATIALPAGRYFIRHTSIKDITISGATAVTSIAGTNVSGNTGVTFVAKFEMGRIKNDGSFNWYSKATGTVDKVSG